MVNQSSLLLTNCTLHVQHETLENGWLLIENSIITALGRGTPPACSKVIDIKGHNVLPGFIDLHVHGARGHSTMHATPEALHAMAQYFATCGVTSFLAATLTASPEVTLRAVNNIAACMGTLDRGAKLLGAYLEGPYISKLAKGAHAEAHIRIANPREYEAWFATGAVKIMTIAPEYSENMDLIKACAQRGIVPSVGHSTATYEQTNEAIEAGARLATHTFNAMTGIHHRNPGTTGAVLTNDAITCELIADGVHLHPAILKLAVNAKGTRTIVLVTDGEVGMGMHPGCYDFDGHKVQVTEKAVYLPEGTLAGSLLTMPKALQMIMQSTDMSIAQAWPMTSQNAARLIGLERTKGTIGVGYDADIVVLNKDDYSVHMTLGEGTILYTK